AAEMAAITGVSEKEYSDCEAGQADLNFAFLYRCAQALGVDVTEIIEGAGPKLTGYTVTRAGLGARMSEGAHGLEYYNLAAAFRNRIAEPLLVRAVFDPAKPMEVTSHDGQECDIVLSGRLMVQVGGHIETLGEGDCIYYDSSLEHGLKAIGGRDCMFYAIVLNPAGEVEVPAPEKLAPVSAQPDQGAEERIYKRFIEVERDENRTPYRVEFKNTEGFNFAFDVVDYLAERAPEKLAMLHVDIDKNERRFTFEDISRMSSRAANYFKSLGIKKGDRVMLVLRRNWEFWPIMIGLNKLGAIAIPATDQLQQKDFDYRFNFAGISTVICTDFGEAWKHIEEAMKTSPTVQTLIMTGKNIRPGWHDYNGECEMFRSVFPRTEDSPKGEDLMLMYFTSGTSGYPKLAAHNYKYPLGHFITAKYWQCAYRDGLHLTISDTGWAKAMWGKLYGQWLSEAAVFVYDFDRFDAADILPMFAKYGITTFCAPPTMYRMLIKQDISQYDLSSVRHAAIAGEALNPEVFHQFRKATGLPIMEGFGQSESTVMIANLLGTTPKIGSMGQPVPTYPIELLSREGEIVTTGETGEICVRCEPGEIPGLFVGYYNDPEKTAEAWHDGYYHTGDLAWKDEDGYYWYVGRADDLIKSSGYRIGPFEIESVLMELPYVLECGVSPAPDPVRGQVVKASIVLVKGTDGSDELKKEIQEYVKKRTAPYKYPRIVEFKESLPKTTSGKIQRNLL
ncbi:MAG: AMP-binding protein, partial [Oscillospiraceae bacterium]|nr:AMP-binding protein [Oscillospiraceae bacterium]